MAKEVVRLNRLQLKWYVKRHEEEPPEEIVLEIDTTHDPTHGTQQRSFFHGFYVGGCEQYIKELKEGSAAELISSGAFVANAFRLLLHGWAYTMVNGVRQDVLKKTKLEKT